jgi:hypothetical protein
MYVYCPLDIEQCTGQHLMGYSTDGDVLIYGRYDQGRLRELTAKDDAMQQIGVLKRPQPELARLVESIRC